VAADVKQQLAPKWPTPNKYMAPRMVKHFVDMLERPSPVEELSDYDRSIVQSVKAIRKTIVQPGEQKNQELPPTPLNVYSYDELEKPLLIANQFTHLGTQMRRLHYSYMKAYAKGDIMLTAVVRDEHYFYGDDEIIIKFEELFQLFN
jgi:hypothetical protein